MSDLLFDIIEKQGYPKLTNIKINNTYSCDVCGKFFDSKNELIKDPFNNFLTICSKKCEFKFILDLIKKQEYSKENLKLLVKIIGKEQQSKEFNEDLAIYELSKYYQKIGLSNIKYLGSRLNTKVQGSTNSSKAQGSSFLCICNIHNEPELEPNFELSHNGSLSLTNFGEIII